MTRSPTTPAASSRVLVFVRLRLATATVCVLGALLAAVLFVAAIISHQDVLFIAALVPLVASVLGQALTEGLRSWLLWREGVWVDLNGTRRTRSEQPIRFKTWLTMHLLFAAVSASAAVYLAWCVAAKL